MGLSNLEFFDTIPCGLVDWSPKKNSNNCLVCCKLDSQYLSIEFNLQNVCEVIWIFAFVCKHNRIRDKACEKHAQILEWEIYGPLDELSLCESLKDKLVVQNPLIMYIKGIELKEGKHEKVPKGSIPGRCTLSKTLLDWVWFGTRARCTQRRDAWSKSFVRQDTPCCRYLLAQGRLNSSPLKTSSWEARFGQVCNQLDACWSQ